MSQSASPSSPHPGLSPSVQALLELRETSEREEQAKKTAQREWNEKVHRAVAALRLCSWNGVPDEIRVMGTKTNGEARARAQSFVTQCWLPAGEFVTALVTADAIERIKFPDATLVTFGRDLFLRLIRAEDRSTECETIARELADAARSFPDLAEELHFFPGLLAGEIERLSYPRILADLPTFVLQPRSEPSHEYTDQDTAGQQGAPLSVPDAPGVGQPSAAPGPAAIAADQATERPWKDKRTGGMPLRGWDGICEHIGVENDRNRRESLKRLNTSTGGPIGWCDDTPEVDPGELKAWIEDTRARDEAIQRLRGDKLVAEGDLGARDGAHAQDYGAHIDTRHKRR